MAVTARSDGELIHLYHPDRPDISIDPARQGAEPHHPAADDPHQHLAEERRLFYVTITRARDELIISHAAAGRDGGRAVWCIVNYNLLR